MSKTAAARRILRRRLLRHSLHPIPCRAFCLPGHRINSIFLYHKIMKKDFSQLLTKYVVVDWRIIQTICVLSRLFN